MEQFTRTGLGICTPIPTRVSPAGNITTENVTVDWMRHRYSLMMPTNFSLVEFYVDGLEVGKARNYAIERALEHKVEFLLFIDYDVLLPYNSVAKLHFLARKHPDYDVFSGLYCSKSEHPEPLVYVGDYGKGCYWDFTLNDVIYNVSGIHMGLTLLRMSLFDKLPKGDDGWFKTPNEVENTPEGNKANRGTEDLYFCRRLINEANGKILCDTSIYAPHIDNRTGIKYGLREDAPPVKRAYWLSINDPIEKKATDQIRQYLINPKEETEKQALEAVKAIREHTLKDKQKTALDIGAGEHKLKREGYEVYGTDIRNGVTDHCCHSLQLNLPDNFYDLVYSSHHFEHFDRNEQLPLWQQAFRVCKPDGLIEIIVPNVMWAAKKIAVDCELDEHCLNVLHGAGADHNYERQYNTHYFSYTKAIAKAFAEKVGFVDVTAVDWEDVEELGYNIVLKGRKPNAKDSGNADERETDRSNVHDSGRITASPKPAKSRKSSGRRRQK